MSEDQSAPQPEKRAGYSTGLKIFLIVLGIVFLAPGACGGVFFGYVLEEWGTNSSTDPYLPLVAVVASFSILLSALLVSLLLRFVRWEAAPKGSLIISIISAITLLLTVLVLNGDIDSAMTEEFALYMGLIIVGLVAWCWRLFSIGGRKTWLERTKHDPCLLGLDRDYLIAARSMRLCVLV